MTQPRRPRYEMPDFIRDAILEHRLDEAYRSRPPYPSLSALSTPPRVMRCPYSSIPARNMRAET